MWHVIDDDTHFLFFPTPRRIHTLHADARVKRVGLRRTSHMTGVLHGHADDM